MEVLTKDIMGSIMIEENVVSVAGAHNRADEKILQVASLLITIAR